MSIAVSVLTFMPLLIVAFAHLLWALGTNWPFGSEPVLANAVIGTPGRTRMPNRWLVFLTAVLLLVAAIAAMALADPTSGGMVRNAVGVLFALGFVARGVIAYTPAWRARHSVEPFATLDRKNYAPLCLWVGAGFLILVLLRLL